MKIIIMAIKKDLDRAFFTPFNRAMLFSPGELSVSEYNW